MKIAILDDYAGVSLSLADWDSLDGADITVFTDTLKDHGQLVERLRPFEVICIMRERTPFTARLMADLPQLKLLVTTGPRNLSIDLEGATKHNVVVCGTESRKTTTSELATLLMLALSRGLFSEVAAMQRSGWQAGLGRDLHGQNLGIIGLGKIGAQMANLGQAFGMNVHAWSQNLKPERCAELDVTHHTTLESLMQHSDVVTVHMVHSSRSTDLITKTAFKAMRERAIFINTSRGPIANQADLLEGMKAGKPWMAGLDVYDEEPLPKDHPLRDTELCETGRLLLSPHLGYATEQTFRVYYVQTVEAIAAWQVGSPIRKLN